MRKQTHIFTFVLAIAALFAQDLVAQSSSTAVMQVRAEVVSATQIAQVHNNDLITVKEGEEAVYGEFTIRIPEGTDFITESDDSILLNSSGNLWKMNSTLQVETGENGNVSLQFLTGGNHLPAHGNYRGTQVATIQYL